MNKMFGAYAPTASKFGDEFRFKTKVSSYNAEDNFYENFYFSSCKKIFYFNFFIFS